MVTQILLPRSLRDERHFRWRGGEVSRIEGLSDAVFALMCWRAWRLRVELDLNDAEIAATRGRLQRHLATVAIGAVSMIFAIFIPGVPALAGLVYFLTGPVHG